MKKSEYEVRHILQTQETINQAGGKSTELHEHNEQQPKTKTKTEQQLKYSSSHFNDERRCARERYHIALATCDMYTKIIKEGGCSSSSA